MLIKITHSFLDGHVAVSYTTSILLSALLAVS